MQYVVPMYESERGWGAKVDGYVGPFDKYEKAIGFIYAYNLKYNNEDQAPDYYIKALTPVEYTGQACEYHSGVDGKDYRND